MMAASTVFESLDGFAIIKVILAKVANWLSWEIVFRFDAKCLLVWQYVSPASKLGPIQPPEFDFNW